MANDSYIPLILCFVLYCNRECVSIHIEQVALSVWAFVWQVIRMSDMIYSK